VWLVPFACCGYSWKGKLGKSNLGLYFQVTSLAEYCQVPFLAICWVAVEMVDGQCVSCCRVVFFATPFAFPVMVVFQVGGDFFPVGGVI